MIDERGAYDDTRGTNRSSMLGTPEKQQQQRYKSPRMKHKIKISERKMILKEGEKGVKN